MVISPKKQRKIERAEARKNKAIETRKKRREKSKAVRHMRVGWEKRVMAANANGAIFEARWLHNFLKGNPNPGLLVIAQKGMVAERAVRIACQETGINLPKAVFMKASPGIAIPSRKRDSVGYRSGVEKGSDVLAEHIKRSPNCASFNRKTAIILLDDKSVGGTQNVIFYKALEKAFPKASIVQRLPFGETRAEVPSKIKLPEPRGDIIKYPQGRLYVWFPDQNKIYSDPVFKRWQIDLRKEIRNQLREKKEH